MVMNLVQQSRPSLSMGYARSKQQSANPYLWEGMISALCPEIVYTGINTVKDLSSAARHGSTNGAMSSNDWVSKAGRRGLDLDGSNDYISVPHNPVFNVPVGMSMSVWVNLNSVTDFGNLMSVDSNSGYRVRVENTSLLPRYFNQGGTRIMVSTRAITLGKWEHIVTTDHIQKGGTLYLNGIIEDTLGTAFQPPTGTSQLEIGTDTGTSQWTNGVIAIAILYDRVLSHSEVQMLYRDPYAPFRLRQLFPVFPPVGGVDIRKQIISAYMRVNK